MHLTPKQSETLLELAKKYVWYKSATEAIQFPQKALAHIMTMVINNNDEVVLLLDVFGKELLNEVLLNAEIGQFTYWNETPNDEPWVFWNAQLGLNLPLPQNRFKNNKYQNSDYRSLELHRLVANKIKDNPELIGKAISNIDRWKTQNDFHQPYLDEWLEHINKGVESLISFLISETEEAARLRSSSPFVGIITSEERNEIFKKFD